MLLAILLSACSPKGDVAEQTAPSTHEESTLEENEMTLSINGREVTVSWENNKSVAALAAYVENKKITVHTTRYGGFEQVGSLPQSFTRSDVQMTTEPGDIVLYSGNQIVLFFGSNSWSYTKLGHMDGLSGEELSELLGNDTAEIVIE